ncbi:unnamed protein product, partial [Ixodes persulcatus]
WRHLRLRAEPQEAEVRRRGGGGVGWGEVRGALRAARVSRSGYATGAGACAEPDRHHAAAVRHAVARAVLGARGAPAPAGRAAQGTLRLPLPGERVHSARALATRTWRDTRSQKTLHVHCAATHRPVRRGSGTAP